MSEHEQSEIERRVSQRRQDDARDARDQHTSDSLDVLRDELAAVNSGMLNIAERLVTADQVEARVQEAEVKESLGRRQLALAIAVAVMIVAILGGISIVQVASTNRTVTLIESCTIVGGECYQRLAKEGQLGITRNASFLKCVLLIRPEERTEAKMDDCVDRVYGDLINGAPRRP